MLLIPALVLACSLALPVSAVAFTQTLDLVAGQNEVVGTVSVSNDNLNIYVTYTITDVEWAITETHVHVATSIDDIPQTKSGNPKVGQFASSSEHDPGVTTVTNTIPLGGMTDWVVIAAHAVVYKPGCDPQEETAWAISERFCNGFYWASSIPFDGRSWAEYFEYFVP